MILSNSPEVIFPIPFSISLLGIWCLDFGLLGLGPGFVNNNTPTYFRSNKSKALAMGAGHVKNVGNVLFIILSLFFLIQFK